MTKPSFENGRIVPITQGRIRASQGQWTPRTPDATEQTYEHIMNIGALNMQEFCRDKRDERRRKALAGLSKTIDRLKRKRDSLVVPFDNK